METFLATGEEKGEEGSTPLKVGVIFCGCMMREGVDVEEVVNALHTYDSAVQVMFIEDMCTTFPEQVKRLATWRFQAAVLPLCCQERNPSSFTALLRQAGLQPFSVELLGSPLRKAASPSQEVTETFIDLMFAAVLRAKVRAGLTPDYLKVAPLPGRGTACRAPTISRRDLLFSLLHRQYEVIPAVDPSSCTASTGCRLCLSHCPEGAISFQEGRMTIRKESCTRCGLCLTTCPEQAILFPPFSPKELDAQLTLLLGHGEKETTKRVLLFACQQATSSWMTAPLAISPLQIFDLRLPSLALLTPFLLFKALSLGAAGIVLLRCSSQSCSCHDRRFQDMLSFSEALLTALGVDETRLCSLDAGNESEELLSRKLQAFLSKVERLSFPFSQEEKLQGNTAAASDLASLLSIILGSLSPSCKHLAGEEVPFGFLTLQGPSSCTFCGVCPSVCPTKALTIEEEKKGYHLSFTHALCVACGECVRHCPEQVLSLEKKLDFTLLQKGSFPLAQDEIVSCQECGEEIAPASMLAKVQKKLLESDSQKQDWLLLCSTCRLKKSLRFPMNISKNRSVLK